MTELHHGAAAAGGFTADATGAQCSSCGREFERARSCTTATIPYPDGSRLPAIRYGRETDQFAPREDRCPDCGVAHGGYHHPFCEVERCPRCNGRLMTCGCLDSDRKTRS